MNENKSLTMCMEERESFCKRKIQPAAKLGKIHEHSICYLCSQRSGKLPCRDTWLLAHLIYFSPVILLRWRTLRASNPFLGMQWWCWSSCWYLACMTDLGPHPSVQLSGIPGSCTAPGAWPWELKGKYVLSTKEQKSHLNIALLTFAGWAPWDWRKHWKKKLLLSHPCQDLVLVSCHKEISPILKHIVIPSLKQPTHTKLF